jgi:hypothetical protein
VLVYEHDTSAVQFPQSNDDASAYNQKWAQEASGDICLDVSDLRCTFQVQRYALYYANQALITIYNLNATTENSIIQQGYRIIVEAGYDPNGDGKGNYGQIFDGTILMCNRFKQNGTDYILQILALDGADFLKSAYCSFTYLKGQTARDVINTITNKAAVPIKLGYASPVFDTIPYSKGSVVHGLAKDTLSDIAKTHNGTWFIDNGQLYIIAYSDDAATLPMGLQAIELNEKTGLIGNPQLSQQCVNARMLINPQVSPYSLVHISSELITQALVTFDSSSGSISNPVLSALDPEGLYRVISVTFTGDTRGNDWYADIVAATQAGKIAANLTIN